MQQNVSKRWLPVYSHSVVTQLPLRYAVTQSLCVFADKVFRPKVRKAHGVLTDPTRRAQYDEDLHVKAFHVNGDNSVGQNGMEARFEELRNWSYEETERQRGKERAERRARDQAPFEADEADAEDREERRSQAGLDVAEQQRQAEEEERKRGVQAEKERRAEDERGRQRQVGEFRTAKLAARARKVQAVRGEMERKAREVGGARLAKKAPDERGGKREDRLAAARKPK